ncbi:MAG: hypothetical protein IKQ87_06420, partial [Clostridia bacterium]|nr:hypothetical protein [Clostridia bacterium]
CHDGVVRPGTKGCTPWRERASNLSVPLNMGMAPCNQELKRRYALLNNASQSEGRLNLRKGGFPRRERPWAAVIPKMPVAEASWARREAIINGRKLRRAFSDLFLSFIKEKTSISSASATAPAA